MVLLTTKRKVTKKQRTTQAMLFDLADLTLAAATELLDEESIISSVTGSNA